MSNYTNEQLMESYKKLPKDVQGAITSIDTADILRQIGDEKNMMIDKVGEMADETGLVLLGFTHPSQFVSNLAERLGIEKSVAKEIAEQVNTRIFFPVRENLKKIHGLREGEEETPTLAESEVGVPTSDADGRSIGKEIKTPEIPVSPTPEAPIAPTTPSLLPSALMPESVILETTMPVQPVPVEPETTTPPSPTSIFEAKTKEGVLRLPAEVSEKKTPTLEEAGAPTPLKAGVGIDPYREPTI